MRKRVASSVAIAGIIVLAIAAYRDCSSSVAPTVSRGVAQDKDLAVSVTGEEAVLRWLDEYPARDVDEGKYWFSLPPDPIDWYNKGSLIKDLGPILTDLLARRDPRVYLPQVAGVLGLYGDAGSVPALIDALESTDKNLRLSGGGALALLHDERAVGPICKLAKSDSDEYVRANMTGYLWNFQGSGARECLLSIATNANETEWVREIAKNGLERAQTVGSTVSGG